MVTTSTTTTSTAAAAQQQQARERRARREKKTAQQAQLEAERAILGALNAATVDAHDVPKQGHNSCHHYDYATAEDMIVEAKRHLAHHGLTVLAGSTQIRPGVGDAAAILAQHFAVVHRKHGELSLGEREWPIVPGDGRPFDKATAAAHTALLAYFLRDLLQLARTEAGTSLDGDDRDDAADRARPQRFSARATRVRRALDATRASLENARTHHVESDARSKKNLVAGIAAELERLGVPVERRRAECKRLLGRAPATLADLAALVRKLRSLGGDLSSEQRPHDDIRAAIESVLAEDDDGAAQLAANDDREMRDDDEGGDEGDGGGGACRRKEEGDDGNDDDDGGSVECRGAGDEGDDDGGDGGVYDEAARELAADFAEEIAR